MNNTNDAFKQAIADAGLPPPDHIIDDGLLHRFSANGKAKDTACWYVFYSDGVAAGSFGNWREGFTQTWCSKAENTMTQAERDANSERIKAIQRQRAEALEQSQKQAAIEAQRRWDEAKPCTDHPYLTRKGIQPHGVKIEGGNLIIPLRDEKGVIWSLQTITPDGDKRFMLDGRVKGCYFTIGDIENAKKLSIVGEGFATGATDFEATGHTVIVAFNAGNLELVCKAISKRYTSSTIIIAGDDDWKIDGNPGRTKAIEAAKAVGALTIFPLFTTGRGDQDTDFNDLARLSGIEAVKQAFDSLVLPENHTENNSILTDGAGDNLFPMSENRPSYYVLDDWTDYKGRKVRPGVYFCAVEEHKTSGEKRLTETWICSPLHIDAVTCDSQYNNHGRLLRFKPTVGKWREWAMPMELLKGAGDELRGELLSMGVELGLGRGRQQLADYLQREHPKRQIQCATQVGWFNGSFVLPDSVIGPCASSVIFQSGERGHDEHTRAGTLEGWKAEIAAKATGNPLLMLGLSASFAGPMLDRCNAEGGGFHLFGDSSTGKSTVAIAACSTWGGSNFMRSWRATANGLEGAANMFNDCLLALDEISECDPRQVGEIVYMIGNGRGKQRASRTGFARGLTSFRCFVISNGERTIATTMQEGGHRVKAGQAMRLMDIPAAQCYGAFDNIHGVTSAASFSDAIKRAAVQHHGHAGRAFLERLTNDKTDYCAKLEEFKSLPMFATEGSEGQNKRAAARFVLIGMAGELATEYGLTGWEEGDALNAAVTCFNLWRAQRGQGNDERRQIIEQVSGFIERHGDGRFSDSDSINDKTIIRDRAGWWKTTDTGRIYLFTSEGMREAVKGFEFKHALQVLQDAGAAQEPGSNGERAKLQRIDGRVLKLYHINPDNLTGGNYGA